MSSSDSQMGLPMSRVSRRASSSLRARICKHQTCFHAMLTCASGTNWSHVLLTRRQGQYSLEWGNDVAARSSFSKLGLLRHFRTQLLIHGASNGPDCLPSPGYQEPSGTLSGATPLQSLTVGTISMRSSCLFQCLFLDGHACKAMLSLDARHQACGVSPFSITNQMPFAYERLCT